MKYFIILFILLLSGCEKNSILNTVYISSIGLDYVDGEYIGYFYSPPTKDLGKQDNSDDTSTVFVITDNQLVNVFDQMFDSAVTNINMHHLKTMILSDEFKDVDILLNYFKYSTEVSYNFHVFITDDDLNEVYKYKSMGNINNLYNFLNSPSLIDYSEHGVERCHFLNFANNYLNEYRYLIVPLVKIEKNSLEEDEFQLKISGYSNIENIYYSDEYKGLTFLYSSDKEVSVNNEIVLLSNYNVTFNSSDNIYNINIKYKKTNIFGSLDIENYITNELNKYLNYVVFLESDIYLIKQYNYLYNKNLDTNKYIINIDEI